jgi:hypothetical protein
LGVDAVGELPTNLKNVQTLKDLKIQKTDGNTGIGRVNGDGQCISAAGTFRV